MSEPAVDVTIVSACRNEVRHIETFLDSVARQEHDGLTLEVIVADGASDDGTGQILAEWARRSNVMRIVENPERIVSTGLNRAIRAARGAIIVRMDVHTEYAPDYVRECVALLERTGADNVGGPARTRATGTLPRAIAAAYHSRFSTGGARFHDENFEGPVDTVTYGCWRASTLERLGLFDENLVRNQDDELNLRTTRAGGVVWQSPRVRSWYSPRPSFGALFRQYFQYGFWKVAVIRKHRLPGSWRHLVPGAAVLLGAALVVAWLAAVLTRSPWAGTIAAVSLVLALGYVACSAVASAMAARRHGWDLLPLLPMAFAVFHVAYGLGFVAGAAYFGPGVRIGLSTPRGATGLTR